MPRKQLCAMCAASIPAAVKHVAPVLLPHGFWQVVDEDCSLAAALLQHAAAPHGASHCEATVEEAAGLSTHVSSRSICNGLHGTAGSTALQQAWEVLHEVLLPVAILLIGVGFSVAALYVALLPLLQQPVSSSRLPIFAVG
jgi:hypothetical protein